MSSPFLGEIRIFGFNFAPRDWAFCTGQTMPIAQYTALFAVIGVTYGGNGQTTFGLPNLSQRAPLSFGQSPGNSNYTLGQQSGFASETLTLQELPIHNHTLFSGTLDVANPDQLVAAPTANALFGRSGPNLAYDTAAATPNVAFAPQALAASTGTSQPHENRQPFLQTNFCICLNGLYPSRP